MRRSLAVALAVLAASCAPSNRQAPPPTDNKAAGPAAAPAASSAATSDAQPSGAAAPPASSAEASAPSSSGAAAPPASSAAAAPAPASSGRATPAPARVTPPEPTTREVTIPAETVLSIRLTTPVASDTSKVEDAVRGTLSKPIVVGGETAIPAGAEVTGSVLSAKGSGRVKGRASLAFRFSHLEAYGDGHQIRTAAISRKAAADTKGDVTKGGIGAGAGAIIGGIAGGGKGAVIGGAIGGTGAVMATKGKEVRLAAGDVVTTRLSEPLKVLVPISR